MASPDLQRLAEHVGIGIPSEKAATCEKCAMVVAAGDSACAVRSFSARTKCCTYIPTLANFSVGGLLLEGNVLLSDRLRGNVGVSPWGMGPTDREAQRMQVGGLRAFGQDESLLCPYFDVRSGTCGVWTHREARCATWFCKCDRGAVGATFWMAMRDWLLSCERALADRLVRDAGFAASVGSGTSEDSREATWGVWLGREREWFEWCAVALRQMDVEELAKVSRSDGGLLEGRLRDAWARLHLEGLPRAVKLGSIVVEPVGRASSMVVGYSSNDPLLLPQELLEGLGLLAGRDLNLGIQALERERGIRVSPALVRKLLDFLILVPAD